MDRHNVSHFKYDNVPQKIYDEYIFNGKNIEFVFQKTDVK